MANPLDKFNARNNSFMDNVKANVSNVLNADPIGYVSEKMGSPLSNPATPLTETVDTRGMYYGSPTTKEIYDYRSDIGTLGNIRHATTTAQYKDKIAQALTPMKEFGAKPGWIANTAGGIGANILGLGHEFKGLTTDWGQIKDPNFWKATGEDVLANLYGSIKGKTGVSEQEIYDSMLGNFIYDEGIMSNVLDWGTITGDKEKKGMSLQRFKNIYEIKKNRQQRIWKATREAEAAAAAKAKAEKKRIEQEKIKTAQKNWKPTYNPASSHAEAQATGGDYHSGNLSTVGGQTTDWGDELFSRGGLAQYAPRGSYFNGGLASLYRHGGF